MKFLVASFFLWILSSTETAAELIPRQTSPPLINNCSAQEDQEFRLAFTQDCRDTYDQAVDLTNVSTILNRPVNPSHYVKLCSEPCLPSVLAHLRGCYGIHDGLAALYEGACRFNQNGVMCYAATYNSLIMNPSWQVKVRAECFVNFTVEYSDPKLTESCSDSCKEGLRRVRNELGCCLNAIYNNSFVGEHLPFANYSLWSNCGLESESPGYCASAGVRPVGRDYVMFAAIVVVMFVLLYV